MAVGLTIALSALPLSGCNPHQRKLDNVPTSTRTYSADNEDSRKIEAWTKQWQGAPALNPHSGQSMSVKQGTVMSLALDDFVGFPLDGTRKDVAIGLYAGLGGVLTDKDGVRRATIEFWTEGKGAFFLADGVKTGDVVEVGDWVVRISVSQEKNTASLAVLGFPDPDGIASPTPTSSST